MKPGSAAGGLLSGALAALRGFHQGLANPVGQGVTALRGRFTQYLDFFRLETKGNRFFPKLRFLYRRSAGSFAHTMVISRLWPCPSSPFIARIMGRWPGLRQVPFDDKRVLVTGLTLVGPEAG